MTIIVQPIDASGGTPAYTAQASRQAFTAHLQNGTARPLGALSGRRPGLGLDVTATSTTWTVQPGAAVVDAAFVTTQAAYEFASDSVVTGAVTAANVSNPRVDIIYLTVNDTAIDSSGLRSGQILYLAGTPAASPIQPALPARSVLLATLAVPISGGGSPSVAMQPYFAVAAGGVAPHGNQGYRDAIVTNPYDGYVIYRQDTNNLEVYNGSTWDLFLPAGKSQQTQSGTTTLTTNGAGNGTVTYPTVFTSGTGTGSVPVPVAVAASSGGGFGFVRLGTLSLGSFTFTAISATGSAMLTSSVTVAWIASGVY